MKSVDDVVAELRIKVAKNLARDVCIVSIDCDDALALSQMAADFSVMLAEGRRAITALQSEAEAAQDRIAGLTEENGSWRRVAERIEEQKQGHCLSLKTETYA